MVRYILVAILIIVPMLSSGQLNSFRLNYEPKYDTIVVDKDDTIVYEVRQVRRLNFADTVPHFSKAHIFTPIFRGIYKDLGYRLSGNYRVSTMTKMDSIRQMSETLIDKDVMAFSSFDVLMYRYMIERPDRVKYAWQQIPDVEDKIKNRRKRLQENDDYQEILKMFGQKTTELSMHKRPDAPKSPWTVTGEENVQLSQLYVSPSWVKGGESSMTLISDLRIKAVYQKGKHGWENNIKHKLGVTYTHLTRARLSDDVVEMSSKYGYKAVSKWYYSFQNTFKTQLFNSYNKNDTARVNPLASILSPAYIQFIFGMDYKEQNISILLSPYTAITTLVLDTSKIDQTRYSVDADKKSKTINGLSVTVNWKKAITKDINYTTKMEIFYEYLKKAGSKRFDWESVIDMRINRFLSTRLLFELRYYDNESKKFQLKENFSISFKFAF